MDAAPPRLDIQGEDGPLRSRGWPDNNSLSQSVLQRLRWTLQVTTHPPAPCMDCWSSSTPSLAGGLSPSS